MSAISIVINAVNNAKAAFESVGNQTVELNKKLNKAAGVMRSLFAVGIAAKFVKDLVGASSETEKLEGIIGRIKERFGDAATTIGDGLVAILGFLEAPIIKIADFIGAIIDGIKKVAAVAAAVLTGSSFKEALNIADEVLAAEKAERAARIEAKKTAEERKKLEKEVADNAIKEAERVAKEQKKNEETLQKLKEKTANLNEKLAEREMTLADKIVNRKEKAEEQWNKYVTALHENREIAAQEHLNTYTELTIEILDLEKQRTEELTKAAEKEEERLATIQEQAIEEAQRQEARQKELETLEIINSLEKERTELIGQQAALAREAEEKRNQAIDKNARKEAKNKERQEQRDQKQFDRLLAGAKRIEQINKGRGLKQTMSESQRLALESDRARRASEEAKKRAEDLQRQQELIKTGEDQFAQPPLPPTQDVVGAIDNLSQKTEDAQQSATKQDTINSNRGIKEEKSNATESQEALQNIARGTEKIVESVNKNAEKKLNVLNKILEAIKQFVKPSGPQPQLIPSQLPQYEAPVIPPPAKDGSEYQMKSLGHLKSIDEKIVELLRLKE